MARIANKLLRQVKRYFIHEDIVEKAAHLAALMKEKPEIFSDYFPLADGLIGFIESIEQTYNQYEEKNKTVMRNLDLSSNELNHANRKLEQLNASINAMLESLGPGLLFFDQNGLCSTTFSKSCLEYLGDSPGNKYIWDVLKLKSKDSDSFKTLMQYIGNNDSAMSFDELMSLAPQMKIQDDGRYLKIEYRPLKSHDNKSKGVLVIITDKTDEEKNKKLLEEKTKVTNYILRLSKNRNGFQKFTKDFHDYFLDLEGSEYLYEQSNESLSRSVHTFKGLAATFCADRIMNLIHDLEEKFIGKSLDDCKIIIKDNHMEFSDVLRKTIQEAENVFGSDFIAQGETITIKKEKIKKLYDLLNEGILGPEIAEIYYTEFMTTPIWDILTPLDYHMQELGCRFGKNIERTIFTGENFNINEDYYKAFFSSLTHIARNIVDHGIEYPEDRKMFGKPENSNIVFQTEKFSKNGLWFRLIIEDDGAGIDTQKIREILNNNGKNTDQYKDSDLLLEIFQPYFTTKNSANTSSGRGIGLNAVYEEVQKLNGHISVESILHKGTRFKIELPLILKS